MGAHQEDLSPHTGANRVRFLQAAEKFVTAHIPVVLSVASAVSHLSLLSDFSPVQPFPERGRVLSQELILPSFRIPLSPSFSFLYLSPSPFSLAGCRAHEEERILSRQGCGRSLS